ncbi:DinB family protein [Yinghuangia sp. ASG 101]|uniref:DinB family protein n=1 Tax=Yinghuangia sp. ASG 101 TaxID=2896848 RepID=UPI001E28711D|nr:DinB family protein [Yinghuangia sp. ASG 101]UGQ12268.1 DinB family protein [Yinghuangia sp. ASG 101]
MGDAKEKADLSRYLQAARDALLWKLEGLGEYDVRRPLTPTGTNLLGLVKHASGAEIGYFGECFGRPFPEEVPWAEADAEINSDMWATPEESREEIVGLYRRVWRHTDATVAELPLDAPAQVSWWPPERRDVTLHQLLVHVIADLQRHAGHADILRELVDGTVGMRLGNDNMPSHDAAYWEAHRNRLEDAARRAGGGDQGTIAST